MSKRRMDAYYYGFEPTGSETIDKILGAVACAGKSSHHTEGWDEEACPYDDHVGKTPTEWIQNAAIEAAAENARLREALEEIANAPVPDTRFNGRGYVPDFDGFKPIARAALAEKEST